MLNFTRRLHCRIPRYTPCRHTDAGVCIQRHFQISATVPAVILQQARLRTCYLRGYSERVRVSTQKGTGSHGIVSGYCHCKYVPNQFIDHNKEITSLVRVRGVARKKPGSTGSTYFHQFLSLIGRFSRESPLQFWLLFRSGETLKRKRICSSRRKLFPSRVGPIQDRNNKKIQNCFPHVRILEVGQIYTILE